MNLYNLKKMESKNDILNNSTYVERFISSAKPIINDLTETIDNSKENIIKQFKRKIEIMLLVKCLILTRLM